MNVTLYTDASVDAQAAGMGIVIDGEGLYAEASLHAQRCPVVDAEALAILYGLMSLRMPRDSTKVRVVSDCLILLDLMNGNLSWRTRKLLTRRILAALQATAGSFRSVSWYHVKGHEGHTENERAHRLANDGRKAGKTVWACNQPDRAALPVLLPFATTQRRVA